MRRFLPVLGILAGLTWLHRPETAAGMHPDSGARLSGTVHLEGPRPERSVVKMQADPPCVTLHQGREVLSERELVAKTGAIQNVFVYIKEGPPLVEPVEGKATLDQQGCVFVPRVQGMLAGQTLEIVNSDPCTHNVRSFARKNRPFNISQPRGGTRQKSMTRPEHPVKLKCDIHPWMSAYVFVMEHPFFAVTGPDGVFQIDGLPAGRYTLAAWHERYGELTKSIVVSEEERPEIQFRFKSD